MTLTKGLRRPDGRWFPRPELSAYRNMLGRCYSPRSYGYAFYGARGIKVCDEWLGRNGFARFFEHIGAKPDPKLTLERLDVNRDYEPGNVRWATWEEQAFNMRNTRRLTVDGETRSAAGWSKVSGIAKGTINQRIRAGWSPKEAVFTPVAPGLHHGLSEAGVHGANRRWHVEHAKRLAAREAQIRALARSAA